MAVNLTSNNTGYLPGGAQPGIAAIIDDPQAENAAYWPLSKCVRAFTTYLNSKSLEIKEQQIARRYRHGAQWTSDQVKKLNLRKQPIVTYNRIGRKIDGIVGLVEKLRQDPKAYPRTPQHQEGADLATAVLRYIMDRNHWEQKTPLVAELAAIDGLAGIELGLKQVPMIPSQMGGPPLALQLQQPDYDVTLDVVDNEGFFYDPRSMKHDFSDARWLGMGKWLDEELLKQLIPQIAQSAGYFDRGLELTTSSDRDSRWFMDTGEFKQVRLVDIWYKHRGGWCWALFTGARKVMEGQSPFVDEYNQQMPKYLMFSAAIDHDGDRYGFPRNLQSAQDEINQRRSKALHELSNRRIRATKAAIADNNVEALRREAARADGIILSNTSLDEIAFDDQAKQAAVMGHLEFLREAKNEIENFGPNPALIGQAGGGLAGSSGRAIALMQQAGVAELGPYMLNLRAWKLRVYRALFNAVQKYWTNERWIRVTDNQGLQQFIQVNALQVNGFGQVQMTNAIGQLDVDIILDEGPDTVTLMQDTYDAISNALPSVAKILAPQQAQAVMDVLVETSPLPADVKRRFREAGQQQQPQGPPPEVQAKMAEMQMEQQNRQQQMQLDQQQSQQRLAIDAAKMQQEGQLKREGAAADIAMQREALNLKREQAYMDMNLEREKANNQMAIEQHKAVHQANLQQQKLQADAMNGSANDNGADNELDARVLHYRNGLVLDRHEQRNAADAQKASQLDQALANLVHTIGQSHAQMMAAMNRPRRIDVQRHPQTGRVISATSVREG